MTEHTFKILAVHEEQETIEVEWSEGVILNYTIPPHLADATEEEFLDWLVELAPVELIERAKRQRLGQRPAVFECARKLVGKQQIRAPKPRVPEVTVHPVEPSDSELAEVTL